MFWNPSNSRISKRWFKDLREKRANGELFYEKIVRAVTVRYPALSRIVHIIIALLTYLMVSYFGGLLGRKKEELLKVANKVSKTGYMDTFTCLFADLMRSLKFSVMTFTRCDSSISAETSGYLSPMLILASMIAVASMSFP